MMTRSTRRQKQVMNNFRKLILLVAAFFFSIALAQEKSGEPLIKVFKARGSLQCEPQSGITPEAMRSELENAGVTVESMGCGSDGLMHPAVCGAANGAIDIFEIPRSSIAQAESMGFKVLDGIPAAREIPCR